MLTERDVSIVRQTCVKTAAELIGNSVEHMEPSHRNAILKNKKSISNYVLDLAKDFEKWINEDLSIKTEKGATKDPSVESINLIVKRGDGKGEKYSTYPYYFFFNDLGFTWNKDKEGYIGQLTVKQLQDMKESEEEIEITLGKKNKRQAKFKVKEIMNDLLKVEEEKNVE